MDPAPASPIDRVPHEPPPSAPGPTSAWSLAAVALAAVLGLGLMLDAIRRSSATYDEVKYLEVAARWWRTGDQEEISRMGSPVTFWKLQQAPVLWALDRSGRTPWIDDPIGHQAELLTVARAGGLWIWAVALVVAATWARLLYGPRAMALAAWLFALSPNLLAHGGLVTMELPLVASTTAMLLLFWRFLQTGRRRDFWLSAAVGGLAWSCKFTTVLLPPMLAALWWADLRLGGDRRLVAPTLRVARGMAGFLAAMLLANWAVTGFASLPLAHARGDHPTVDRRVPSALRPLVARAIESPIPQDLVGFANQIQQQRAGGPSYLFGERRMRGWWYYYLVAAAVKVPLTFWVLAAGRALLGRSLPSTGRAWMLPALVGMFLVVTAVGSSRNYGFRYLLPLAPLAIVWVSGLAEGGRGARALAAFGLLGQGLAVASIHPHELTYFNAAAGGPVGGRHLLADSNLDWGQGLRSLARLQRARPEYRDLTLYYFGDADTARYDVAGRRHTITAIAAPDDLPPQLSASTHYLAVSASLQHGPWGPAGYFRELDRIEPVAMTDDRTIAIYCVDDLASARRGGSAR